MAFGYRVLLATILVGLTASEAKKEVAKDEVREKRGFFSLSHEVPVYHPSTVYPHTGPFHGLLSHNNHAHAAANAAHISKAAHVAHALAFDETTLAAKTSAAVHAADKTYNIALELTDKIREALFSAKSLTSQAWKSLEAAKLVEEAQSAMVYEAQRAADALSHEQLHALSELQAAQAAAVNAQFVASKAIAIDGGKNVKDLVYTDDVHH